MPREKFRRETVASTDEKCLGVRERRVNIPMVDNKEFEAGLIARIEAVTLKIIEQISTGRSPCVTYSSGRNATAEFCSREGGSHSERSTDHRRDTMSSSDSVEERDTRGAADESSENTTVDFGVKRSREKFTLMVATMAEVHRLLLTNTTRTRRSFYYDLKNETTGYLAPSQKYVDRALNDVANLLECAPWDLRLLATSKGLAAGNMTITLVDDEAVSYAIPGGALIPQIISNVTSVRAKAEFVLVVEKDAIFQKLLEENCPRALNCILLTGKGYPDVATRMLVRLLSEKMELPVYIVVDADPFGVDIMLVYRFGSTTLCKENASLACPNARWLGVHPSELIHLGAKTVPLIEADLARLRSIETRTYVTEAVSMQLNILRKGKAEIEAVSALATNFLTATYLPYKIDGRDYI